CLAGFQFELLDLSRLELSLWRRGTDPCAGSDRAVLKRAVLIRDLADRMGDVRSSELSQAWSKLLLLVDATDKLMLPGEPEAGLAPDAEGQPCEGGPRFFTPRAGFRRGE